MKAALIATGNEIVSGQIVNTNVSKLANLLSQKGVEVAYHLAVPDDEVKIKESLSLLKEKRIDHVFTIGGLGPTRDDLTRKIVADFFKKDFVFEEHLWVELQKLLSKKIIKAREGHKWQCYFPEGSKVLMNSVGTAHGFKTSDETFSVWCLPGPPEEMVSVFKNGIEPWLLKNVKEKIKLYTWQCIDIPESELSYKVEEAMKGCDYEIGYRASPPIVEVKMWVPENNEHKTSWLNKMEEVVSSKLFSRQGDDYFEPVFSDLLKQGKFYVVDEFSKGYLYECIKKSFDDKWPEGLFYQLGDSEKRSKGDLNILVDGERLRVSLWHNNHFFEKEFSLDLEIYSKSKRYIFNIVYKLVKSIFDWQRNID